MAPKGGKAKPKKDKEKPKKGKKEKEHTPSGGSRTSDESASGMRIPPTFFKPLIPINILMGLVLGLLALCALDPEDCALIPGIGETLADQSALLGGLKHNLDGKATNMWLGQTLISGVFSWKALKDADDQIEGRRAGGSSVDRASIGTATGPAPAPAPAPATGKKSPKKGK